MKRYFHWVFYAAALISTVGMFAQWNWIKGGFDGWFPVAMVAFGQLARIRNGLQPDIFDRTFRSRAIEKAAIGSIVAFGVVIAGWYSYLVYYKMPKERTESVEQFKHEWAESKRGQR